MTSLEKIIESSNFLLQFQKDAIIERLIDTRVAYLTFLDEVFRELLGKGIDESLSALERRSIDCVLDDMVGKIDD